MAKKRKTRVVYRRAPKKRRSYGRKKEKFGTVIISGAGYGAVREKLNQLLTPITARVPLGIYADEVALGALGWAAAKGKFGNNKTIKNMGRAALTVESALIGQTLVKTGMSGITGSSNSNADMIPV